MGVDEIVENLLLFLKNLGLVLEIHMFIYEIFTE
jgi:hypothetical protein